MSYFHKREPLQIVQSIFAYELRDKPVPPIPNGFIAYVHATFMKKVFYISQREWKPYIKHNCKLDCSSSGFLAPLAI